MTVCGLSLLVAGYRNQQARYLLQKLVSLLSFDAVLALMAILLSVDPVLLHDKSLSARSVTVDKQFGSCATRTLATAAPKPLDNVIVLVVTRAAPN